MFSYNNLQLIGKVGRAEVRIAGETELIDFSIATSYYVKGKEPVTTWHNCTLWKPTEFIKKNIVKGKTLFVEGEQNYSEWEKDGVKHVKGNVNVRKVVFLGKNEAVDKADDEPVEATDAPDAPVEDLPF